ncbi:MAG: hypothetical protein PHO29_00320 [Acetobacterium sp.]|nr:hypothetical protein [Acetobacterium sp.]
MKQQKIRTIYLGAVLLVGGMLVLSGCTAPAATTSEAESRINKTVTVNPATAVAQQALKFYHSVTLDQPRAQVETNLGVSGEDQPDGRVAYRDPDSGYGVLISYGEDQTVFAKRLIPTALATELATLNPLPVTDKQVYRMATGMPFYEVQEVMGSDGYEISLSKVESDNAKQLIGRGWFNPDGSYAVVYLNLPSGQVAGSEFVVASGDDGE